MFQPRDLIIPDGQPYPAEAMRVDSDDGVTLKAYPEGGGFIYLFDKEAQKKLAFRLVTDADKDSPFRQATFTVDDGETTWRGWHFGGRWNGWAMPLFDRETFTAILRSFGDSMKWNYDEGTDTFTYQTECDEEPYREKGGKAAVPGQTLYGFDGWCWTEVE